MQTTTFRIFLASPGGLEEERQAVRDEVERFSDYIEPILGVKFTVAGLEEAPGGAGRAQSLINEVLVECDLAILIMWDRWGSAPADGGEFTSGTEEEFYLADAQRTLPDRPMRDILPLFKGVSERQLADPGEQLAKVLAFKAVMEESRSYYYKTFDHPKELVSHLRTWLNKHARETYTNEAEPIHRSEIVEAGAAVSDLGKLEPAAALVRAREFEDANLAVQAESAYAAAVAEGDPESLEDFARFLRRSGRIERSLSINEQLLGDLASVDDDVSVNRRARALANIGIIARKRGELERSRASLDEAVRTARSLQDPETPVLTYALDNLGHTLSRTGELDAALSVFSESLSLRESDASESSKSQLHIARIQRRRGQLDEAEAAASAALQVLGNGGSSESLAEASALLGEIFLEEGKFDEARSSFREALRLNEVEGRHDNIAMSLLQVARIDLQLGEVPSAEIGARRALEISEGSANGEGVAGSYLILGRIRSRSGDLEEGVRMLARAAELFVSMRNPTGEGWARFYLSDANEALGRSEEAGSCLAAARRLAEQSQNAALRAATS